MARPGLAARFPVHVTVKLERGLPSLRGSSAHAVLREACARSEHFGFRLVHYSAQSNHVHFIAEATDRVALSRGMKGLLVRVARGLNRAWNRSGRVIGDRFHARILRTPREVRNALAYVLQNARRHGLALSGIDPFSSGRWFDGWRASATSAEASPFARARTWLLSIGWRRHGLIGVGEVPGG